MLMAKIISADALSQRFIPEQSFGKILANYLPEIHGSSAFTGFSVYSASKCYESRHGNGTCSKFRARDGLCLGMCTIDITMLYKYQAITSTKPHPTENATTARKVQSGIGLLENDDLSDKFRTMSFRIEQGRVNEPLFYELNGFHPTQYSLMASQYEGHRYVSRD